MAAAGVLLPLKAAVLPGTQTQKLTNMFDKEFSQLGAKTLLGAPGIAIHFGCPTMGSRMGSRNLGHRRSPYMKRCYCLQAIAKRLATKRCKATSHTFQQPDAKIAQKRSQNWTPKRAPKSKLSGLARPGAQADGHQ